MFKKFVEMMAAGVNVVILCSMVGIGAFYWESATAQQRMNQFTEEDLYCLQQNVYFEARNQSTIGQRAVAWVTLNRVESSRYPNTICGVVWQPKQFSWTHDNLSDSPGTNAIEQQAWNRAGLIARSVIRKWAYEIDSPVESATMFHASYVSPYWSDSYDKVAQIDDHIFYQ